MRCVASCACPAFTCSNVLSRIGSPSLNIIYPMDERKLPVWSCQLLACSPRALIIHSSPNICRRTICIFSVALSISSNRLRIAFMSTLHFKPIADCGAVLCRISSIHPQREDLSVPRRRRQRLSVRLRLTRCQLAAVSATHRR